MKICMLTTSYPRFPGDFAGIFNYRIDRSLVKEGISVRVVAPGTVEAKTDEICEGIRIYRFNYFWPVRWQKVAYGDGILPNLGNSYLARIQLFPFMLAYFLKGFQHARQCDLIHAHWTPSGFVGVILGKIIKKPVALTVGGTDLRSLPAVFSKWVLERVNAIVSPAIETSRLLEKLGFSDYHVIPTLMDEDRFNPNIDASDIRKEFHLKEDDQVVTFIGRLYDFKDPLTFIEAIPLVLQEMDQVKFFIVGDGILLKEIKSRAEQLKVNRDVFITGARADTHKLLKVSSAFTALSPYENTWSNTIAEAMFMDVPVIMTRAGYTDQFFTHKKDCYLIPPRMPDQLAQAIIGLLKDAPLKQQIIHGARTLLKENGKDTSDIVKKIINLYKTLL